ncbi:MAG: cytochrome c oxidase assembly protein [Mesorhizobium sp.]|uniref:cytochrome c oxidase assembly protein n=1 Tax=Mesorhizobium sp. TaxID=1871066 RepID=UPI00122B9AAD|nr:cytochrome c oxidase assembly protein [Mesorhizobium sp.]TIO53857.1 MAG: cytochrome c oxidase assembly protein [Mesorhizobium sp.]TIO61485.1 MAG: cytochrome c oxidase assembly protein [Mesorhizobium sp.]TJV65871.1 MAG: cytochrome c oxidase assembly protein [Mesorhizobium sp.]
MWVVPSIGGTRLLGVLFFGSCMVLAPALTAHGADQESGGRSLPAAILIPLDLAVLLYAAGMARLWRQAGVGRGVALWQPGSFAAGWALLVAALLSPLHELGDRLFTAHMIEHEVLMIAAAPALVLSRPLGAMLWSFPRAIRRHIAGTVRWPIVRVTWRGLTEPASATVLHGFAIWSWHMPVLFSAALAREPVHWLQHVSFLATALLFWWALLSSRTRRKSYGASVFYLFFTSMHCGLLGAILALSKNEIFVTRNSVAAQWGLSALEDQQLGGLIMWVGASAFYLAAALILAAFWIGSGSSAVKKIGSGAVPREINAVPIYGMQERRRNHSALVSSEVTRPGMRDQK